ncbi:MAG: MATE family efflux transporter [Acuticoccus sp.]
MTSLEIARRAPRRRLPELRGWRRDDAAAIVRLAAPVAGLALVNMAMSVTDTLMTAAFGPTALAAVAVASDAYSIVFYLAIGCIGGLAPLYAAAHAAHAAHDDARLARLRAAGWTVAGLLAAPLAMLVFCGPDLLRHLGIDARLVGDGAGYMRAMALTLVPMLAVAVLRTRLTAIERPAIMLKITLAAVPLNAVLNHLLMHGAGGVAGLGVTGAGVSSLVVASVILAALAVETRRVGDRGLAWPRRGEIVEVFRIGVPIGVATLAEVGVYLGATLYAATLSVADAAAHSVAIRTAGVTYAVYIGLQQSAMVRIAREGTSAARRRSIAATALGIGIAAGVGLMAVVVALAGPLPAIVLGEADVVAARIAAALLVLLALSDLFGPGGAVAAGLLRGIRVTRPVMAWSLLGNWLVAVPLGIALTLGAGMGAVGIWIALATGTVVSSVLTIRALVRHILAGG